MKLVFPTIEYKDKAIQYIGEFYDYNSEINGCGGLDRFLKESDYEMWIERTIAYMDIANPKDGRVPSLTYFYVREEDDKILGMINIRLALNDFLKKEGGHIGYSIRPTERRKHYATDMLREGLKVCRTIGIHNVILTCDRSNPASAGVIKNCGGELEKEFYSEHYEGVIQRYVIKENDSCFKKQFSEYNEEFWKSLETVVAESELIIDRPKGTAHPNYPDFIYKVDYGYLKGTTSMDGGGIDVWVGTGEKRIDAILCIVDLLKKDSEIKILLGCTEEEKEIIYNMQNESEYMKGYLIHRNK